MSQVSIRAKVYRWTCLLGVALLGQLPLAAQKPSFTVGWSVYVGWNPYYYMAKTGIMKKWADKYGVAIKVQGSITRRHLKHLLRRISTLAP